MLMPIIDENGRKRCPYCFSINSKIIDYGVSEGKERRFGQFWFELRCEKCNGIYKDITDLGPKRKEKNRK